MSKFDGKVAIVTGGAAGIGGATSRLLAEQGASVLIADINMAEAEANAEAIRAGGGTAETISTNVGKHEEIAAMVQHAIDRWGRLDILVNNAFSPTDEGDGDALTVTEDAWDAGMATLVKAHFLAAKHAVPHMRESGGGSIVNISSVHGLLMAPRKLIYEAGKSAVIGVTKQMAIDFGPDGIRVNAICPGHIVTERQQERWDENPGGLRYFEDQYPCGAPACRWTSPTPSHSSAPTRHPSSPDTPSSLTAVSPSSSRRTSASARSTISASTRMHGCRIRVCQSISLSVDQPVSIL